MQSVLIGGGYATGREIYSYGAKFGAMGWISGLTIGIGFALFAFLTFGSAGSTRFTIIKTISSRSFEALWPMMDILTIIIAILLIAVMAAATGSIFEQVGLPNILGSVVIVLICGLLNFKGSKVIEKFESIGTILLYGGYILFTILVLVNKGSNISHVFSTMDTQHLRRLCHCSAVHLHRYPVCCLQHQFHPDGHVLPDTPDQTERNLYFRSDLRSSDGYSVVLSYFAMMCFYGDTSIVGADVTTPWMEMIKAVNGGFGTDGTVQSRYGLDAG